MPSSQRVAHLFIHTTSCSYSPILKCFARRCKLLMAWIHIRYQVLGEMLCNRRYVAGIFNYQRLLGGKTILIHCCVSSFSKKITNPGILKYEQPWHHHSGARSLCVAHPVCAAVLLGMKPTTLTLESMTVNRGKACHIASERMPSVLLSRLSQSNRHTDLSLFLREL